MKLWQCNGGIKNNFSTAELVWELDRNWNVIPVLPVFTSKINFTILLLWQSQEPVNCIISKSIDTENNDRYSNIIFSRHTHQIEQSLIFFHLPKQQSASVRRNLNRFLGTKTYPNTFKYIRRSKYLISIIPYSMKIQFDSSTTTPVMSIVVVSRRWILYR